MKSLRGKNMKRNLPTLLTLALLLLAQFASYPAIAQTNNQSVRPIDDIDQESNDDVDDVAPVTRAARLSFVDGDVSFLRAGVTEWAPAVENLPLLAGDQIFTGAGARAEVQLARDNYIRLSSNTELTITELSDSGAQFEITEGIAIVRLERLATTFRSFEFDTPNSAIQFQKDGLYRIEVRGEKDSELIVRRGDADVSTEEGSFKVREGRKLLVDSSNAGRLELAIDNSPDDWDRWSYDRDTTIARSGADLSPDYVRSYETDNGDFYGVDDLSSYGTWTSYSSYGQCWIPRVGADWAPYRSGQWLWIPSAGWTWLASEPWGWAPYHYGRWAFLSGLGWAWVPGFGSYRGYGYRDYRWRPALVYFFNSPTPRGNYVGWYPLAPGERWRRHDNRRADDRLRLRMPAPPRDTWRNRDGVKPVQPHRGVTILPVEGFTKGNRNGIRPIAPGRDLSDIIDKGARAGLPDVKPSPIAAAPELGDNDRRKFRRIAIPSQEIIKRPVVTRNPVVTKNPNSDSSNGIVGQRERKVIVPRNPENSKSTPIFRDRGTDRGVDKRPRMDGGSSDSHQNNGQNNDSDGARRTPKIRVPLPSPADKVETDGSTRERKQKHEDSANSDQQRRPNVNNDRSADAPRRVQEQPPVQRNKDNSSNDQHRDGQDQQRDKRPPTSEAKPREDARPKERVEEPRHPDRSSPPPQPRVEPRQERSNSDSQSKQERRQENQQRQERAPQQDQRKKP